MSYVVPFSLHFQAPMSSEQVRWLREELALTFHSKTLIVRDFPYAFGSLDRFSGLFLLAGEEDGWTLECRAYREPTPAQVEGWRTRATWVVEALPQP